MTAKDVLRRSQIVDTFGPGAMVDLPDRSVLVGGLNQWDMHVRGAFQVIEEPGLTAMVEERLRGTGGISDEDVFARVQRLTAGGAADTVAEPRITEFEGFAGGHAPIGENRPNALRHAETLRREQWDSHRDPLLVRMERLVAVHRLREIFPGPRPARADHGKRGCSILRHRMSACVSRNGTARWQLEAQVAGNALERRSETVLKFLCKLAQMFLECSEILESSGLTPRREIWWNTAIFQSSGNATAKLRQGLKIAVSVVRFRPSAPFAPCS